MADPANSVPPPPPHSSGEVTSTGLPANIAAVLACIPLVGGIIFYVLEKRDPLVRFYAMQSIIFGIAWILLSILLGIISTIVYMLVSVVPGVGGVLWTLWQVLVELVHLGLLVLLGITMFKAFNGVRWDIPFIGPMARKQVGGA